VGDCMYGETCTSVCTTGLEHMPAMPMETAVVNPRCIPWKASGRCGAVGDGYIVVVHRRNSRAILVSSSLSIMLGSEAKSCFIR
jgi:hypothetical protein